MPHEGHTLYYYGMISREDIENLAHLSRLKLTEEELAGLEKDFPAILEYVGQLARNSGGVGAVAGGSAPAAEALRNVMREDAPGVTVGSSREVLLAAAPRREGDYFVVRKIIQRDE